MVNEACCTCAVFLSGVSTLYDEKTEKPLAHDRRLDCCGRVICANCVAANSRLKSYCPFCQISKISCPLPLGLPNPPAYSLLPISEPRNIQPCIDELPSYSSLESPGTATDKSQLSLENTEDVLHFIDPSRDSITSLSLQYGIPQSVLRRKNGLFADHLLAGRQTILIPGEFYKGGISLSPEPIGGEEEEMRKAKIRRWMIACKAAEYDIALLYLKQTEYNLDKAIEAYLDDEKWEKDHPLGKSLKGKKTQSPGRRKNEFGIGAAGQI